MGRSPKLDSRHRDKSGAISKKHGNTLVKTLRKIYGPGFAKGHSDKERLSDVLTKLDTTSLSKLVRDYTEGKLDQRVFVSGRYGTLGKKYRL
jgi:hypothetical protein